MDPAHLTNFWERHATVQLKPKAMIEYLLQLFFFWLNIFLVPFGCGVATINGTVMPSLCGPSCAMGGSTWQNCRQGGRGRHCSSWCQSHKCPFPFYAFKHVSAPWIRSCRGMTCRYLVLKNFCVEAGPLISWYVLCETSGIIFYKTIYSR